MCNSLIPHNQEIDSQTGSALVISLVMLLVLTLMAVAGMQTTSLQERMAGNMRDKDLAFQAAEAALREAESYLQGAVLDPFDGTNGLYKPNISLWTDPVVWAPGSSFSWEYEFLIDNVKQLPRYIIEELPPVAQPLGSLAADEPIPEAGIYRITSFAVGGSSNAEVILQVTYKR
ncbi:type IV pilus assembly protein PilX [Desulfonatronum thiosulfatophilum]|uniref:Type IV pilus assembly protein PilX n=1 Tax=Desulfonatronum thiosulfatophilum TaxID=617002 RepID=A0A1G6A3W7_9BACT|nr:PilX N-terminal domain-containing pilus assembly protein [Desulfonatronum thiosulfatophilum]SDB02703.1 type IV pilus assembly protein PilX [Desulfonatronum thiosulfatophilum]